MKKTQTHVVLGAGGATGLQCVKRLLDLGFRVKAVVRDPEKYQNVFPKDERVSVVRGDVTDKKSLEDCLRGADGAVFAAAGRTFFSPKDVDNKGVENVAEVAKHLKVEPIVLVTSALVTPKNRFNPIRMMLNNIRWGLMDEKFKGEEKLRNSGVAYTIVRPGRLTDNNEDECKLILVQGDHGSPGAISRFHVACVCCAALTNPRARNRTFELASQKVEAPAKLEEQLSMAFDSLQPRMHT